MQKWEYLTLTADSLWVPDSNKEPGHWSAFGTKFERLHDLFNAIGEQGWELAAVTATPPVFGVGLNVSSETWYYFKRPKADATSEGQAKRDTPAE